MGGGHVHSEMFVVVVDEGIVLQSSGISATINLNTFLQMHTTLLWHFELLFELLLGLWGLVPQLGAWAA